MESLYRKYRPQTFNEVVGQKDVVATLRNALGDDRLAHAFLFSGPRGTGKTTMARLLAKALLCDKGSTPDPDGTCEQCLQVAQGTHPDVYELDAASNTGVDNVREEIINRVAFAPTMGRKKVYIIDEVHMLTTAAFNALLKTLEEPPGHVVFVLCTTDPQKVPETILSRCQRLEFRRIATRDIEEHLARVCDAEGFAYDREALALVAKHARGGMRDALSQLEKLSTFGNGSVRLADAQSVLGEVSDETISTVASLVGRRDVASCFAHVADLVDRGADIPQFVRDLTSHVRDMYVASVAGAGAFEDGNEGGRLVEEARAFGGPDRLSYALEVLGQLGSELRSSLDQRLSLEVALTRMARPGSDMTMESLAAKVAMLEQRIADMERGMPPVVAGAGGQAPAQSVATVWDAPAQPAPIQDVPAQPVPVQPAPLQTTQTQPEPARMSPAEANVPAGQVSAFGQPSAAGPATEQRPAAPEVAQPTAQPPSRPGSAAEPPAQPVYAPTRSMAAGAAMDPATNQRLWGRVVDGVLNENMAIGALVRNMTGALLDDGTLSIDNHGSAFVIQMLNRPSSMETLQRVADAVYGRHVSIALTGTGTGASAAKQTPRHTDGPSTSYGPAPTQPAPPHASQDRGHVSAPAPQTAPAFTPAPQTAPAFAAQQAPAPASAPAPAPAPAPTQTQPAAPRQPVDLPWGPATTDDASASQVRKPLSAASIAAAAASAISSAPAPADDAVPDDVYDSYAYDVDDDASYFDGSGAGYDEPSAFLQEPAGNASQSAPLEPAPAPASMPGAASPSQPASPQASSQSLPWASFVSSPAPAPAAVQHEVPAPASASPSFASAPAQEAPASAVPVEGTDDGDVSAANLSQLLSQAFGGYVKVSEASS